MNRRSSGSASQPTGPRGGDSRQVPQGPSVRDYATAGFRQLAEAAAQNAGPDADGAKLTWAATDLLLGVAAAAWAERNTGFTLDRPVGPDALRRAWTHIEEAAALAPLPWQVPDWVGPATLRALLSEATVCFSGHRDPFVLGELHETLTALELERANAPSVCLAPSGVWVSAGALLEQPPASRSKWLQRLARLPKTAVAELRDGLASARVADDVVQVLRRRQQRGTDVAAVGSLFVQSSLGRRRAGAHYTPLALAERVVERSLAPLVDGAESHAIVALRVCDPAVGGGVFLYAALIVLSRALERALAREEADPATRSKALQLIYENALAGVDRDARAVDIARVSLGLSVLARGAEPRRSPCFAVGNAILETSVIGEEHAAPIAASFPDVFSRDPPGFDAIVGNPPWVAYVGRAAQPLSRAMFARYAQSPAFRSYRTLHGLFVWKGATLLRPGGRLGLVLPTSMADLDGYAPTRAAHDALAEPDAELFDFGDGAFAEVFQPCMALTSTRRSLDCQAGGGPWPLERNDLAAEESELLEKLAAHRTLPRQLFGERGYQTMKDDLARLRDQPAGPRDVPLHTGGDVFEFRLAEPSCYADPAELSGTFRADAKWNEVRVLIRQTARYPIAALSDGHAFRNSVLAGFETERWDGPALTAYLNSSPIRWYHYKSRRDARQGMPQLKIAHLRALPDVDDASVSALSEFAAGARPSALGLPADQRLELDAVACAALGLSNAEAQLVRRWAEANPPPAPRAGRNARAHPLREVPSR